MVQPLEKNPFSRGWLVFPINDLVKNSHQFVQTGEYFSPHA